MTVWTRTVLSAWSHTGCDENNLTAQQANVNAVSHRRSTMKHTNHMTEQEIFDEIAMRLLMNHVEQEYEEQVAWERDHCLEGR